MLRRRGFTILELVIAVVILSIALFPFLLAMKGSGRSVRGTRDYSWAVFVAQRTIEELRSVRYTKLEDTVLQMTNNQNKIFELLSRDYTREIEILACDVPRMSTCKITVSWTNENDVDLTFETTVLITEAMQP